MIVILSSRTRSFARRQANFVASVTHELRTPLAAIRSMSENLADGIVTDREKIKQYGILINDEEHRLSAMIEQMLGFTGAQSARNGHNELYPQNVPGIIETALEDYRTELVKRQFNVELIVQPNLPFIRGDAEALRRVIGNLIGNAIKYSDEKRRIEIKAHAAADEKNIIFVEISIKDAGIGIDSADLSNVFKLFYRGRLAIQKQIEGSGIGLSVVKQIVEAHRGTITVSSKSGQGSTFRLRLPAISRSANLGERHPPRKL
jgi:two-component system phosphate regulon sensor histidine kinase PhoR